MEHAKPQCGAVERRNFYEWESDSPSDIVFASTPSSNTHRIASLDILSHFILLFRHGLVLLAVQHCPGLAAPQEAGSGRLPQLPGQLLTMPRRRPSLLVLSWLLTYSGLACRDYSLRSTIGTFVLEG